MMSENDFKKLTVASPNLGTIAVIAILVMCNYVTLKSKIKKCWLVQLKKIQR